MADAAGQSAVEDARAVARALDIPYYVMNFKKRIKAWVMDDFAREYFMGAHAKSMYPL